MNCPLFQKFFTRFVFALAFLLFGSVTAATTVWKGVNTDWNDASNWTSGVPIAFDTAEFSESASVSIFPSGTSPNIDFFLTFNGTPSSTIIGPFDAPLGLTDPATITSLSGQNTIAGLVNFPIAAAIITTSDLLTFSGIVSTLGVLDVSGLGITEFKGINSLSSSDPLSVTVGNLQVSSLGALGEATGGVPPQSLTLDDSTLRIGVNGFTITAAIPITLSGSAQVIDTNGFTASLLSVISESAAGKPLTKDGLGTLLLRGANSYSGGTTLSKGVLNITDNGQLGDLSGGVTIGVATLQAGASITLTSGRTVTLSGGIATLDTNGNGITIEGVITGSGLLSKTGLGTLTLTGANDYSGGTTVVKGSLQGAAAPSSVQGNIDISSGASVIFDQGVAGTYAGTLSGAGSITKINSGTLTLSSALSSYSGGTTISEGTLSISQDGKTQSPLGNSSGKLTIVSGAILEMAESFSLVKEREVSLSPGTAKIRVLTGKSALILGKITGSGKLEKTGAGILTITGANTYTGTTLVSGGTLQGDTTGLQGDINISSGSLVFSQAGSGTYAGTLSGAGPLSIAMGDITMTTGGSLTGTTTIEANAQLVMNGSLASSPLTVNAGGILTGTGSVGPTTNSGQVIPGNAGAGTLTVNGDFSFSSGEIVTNLTPTSTGILSVTGTADLTNGTSRIQLAPGFYGITINRTILTAGVVNNQFANVILDPRIKASAGTVGGLIYNLTSVPQSVQLLAQVLKPFLDFPYANANERSTGNNIDAIISSGQGSEDLIVVLDSMQGLSDAQINDALDQMHPAAQGAFSELQVALGGQLLSSLHRILRFPCSCDQSSRFWVQGFGNWLDLKKQGMQIGFDATTSGILVGYDHQFLDFWTVGIAGAYSHTNLKWSLDRGYSYVKGGYGCIYSDFSLGRFFLGGSGYVGKDWYATNRHIRFSTVDRQAQSSSHGFDAGAQMMMAYFLGTPSFVLYPYASLDYLYLENSSFQESGANSLNLRVNGYESTTLRAAAGGTMRFVDRNRDDSFCIAPLVSFGYVLEAPLHRDHYRAKFSGVTIPFKTRGWDQTWQLFNLKFGLELTYRCFTFDAEYIADISPDGGSPYVNQRANFQCRWAF